MSRSRIDKFTDTFDSATNVTIIDINANTDTFKSILLSKRSPIKEKRNYTLGFLFICFACL